jgi:zinc and cadmium transporter
MWFASLVLLAVALFGGALFELSGKRLESRLPLILAFGGAYIVGLLFLHLIPEAYASAPSTMGIFVLIGFILQGLLEYFSQGVEHGHIHPAHGEQGHDHSACVKEHPTRGENESVARGSGMPWAIFLSLCLHALIEAMPLGHAGHDHAGHHHTHEMGSGWAQLDAQLLLGIAMHHVPVAVVIMGMMQAMGVGKGSRWIALAVFGLMPALGMGLFEWLMHSNWTLQPNLWALSQGVLIGFLLHISTTMLFESGDGHRFNAAKLAVTLLGLLIAVITL